MSSSALLNVAIFLPLAGAITVWSAAAMGREIARSVALLFTLATLVVAAVLLARFPEHGDVATGFAVTEFPWMGDSPLFDVRYSVGLDGLGLWLFGLSALLMITAVLVSWEAITERAPLFYGMLLILEFGCLGVFSARDIILFYVFFEFTLIPLFFLIGIWGSEDRRYAAIKFFVFTLAGSLLTFVGLLAIVWWAASHSPAGTLTFDIAELTQTLKLHPIRPAYLQIMVFVALFAGFAIKVPLFPLHTWLPLAHVQAPTAGSVILAGILLKIGTYGFVRFSLPMLPAASVACFPFVICLAVTGIVYGALVALAQQDIKRLIAYSSVSHLGFCMLGLFAFNPIGLAGGTLQMVNHGLSTGGLFALVGMLYERYHTREIRQFGGLARRLPWLAFFMLVFTFSSIGLPGLNGFVGEFMVLLAAFQRAWTGSPASWQFTLQLLAVLAVSGVVLGAWYMLWLVQRVFFGPLREPRSHHEVGSHATATADLSWREIAALAPLAVLIVWIGVQPGFFLSRMQPTLNGVASLVESSMLDRLRSDERVAIAASVPTHSDSAHTADPSQLTPTANTRTEPSGIRNTASDRSVAAER
ncbi:MAG: NuoM family protein [Pirellulaceae bacterium]